MDTDAEKLEENVIKRERNRKRQIVHNVEKLRLQLPQYNLKDIRRHKLLFDEALLIELEESGHIKTANYLKEVFLLQETLRNNSGIHSKFWQFPILQYSKNELTALSEALVQAEIEYNKQNFHKETEILLKIAIDFCFKSNVWFWLAEHLIVQCIKNSSEKNENQYQAIASYIYAKLLIEKVENYETAEEYLNIARTLSEGKSWNVKSYIDKTDAGDTTTIFIGSNYLLYLCYMRQAHQWAKTNLETAIEYAILASQRASEACYHEGQTSALLLKGQCELDTNQIKSAIRTFSKAYHIQERNKNVKAMSEVAVQLIRAYLIDGNSTLALQHLNHLKEIAEEHNLQFYLAQAYRYVGEQYLFNGHANLATPLLSDALNIFHQCNAVAEFNQVRALGTVSVGLELLPKYIEVLTKTDSKQKNWYENLMKLVYWKESREPFWMDDTLMNENISEEVTEAAATNGKDEKLITEEAIEVDEKVKVNSQTVLFTNHQDYQSIDLSDHGTNNNETPLEKNIQLISEPRSTSVSSLLE